MRRQKLSGLHRGLGSEVDGLPEPMVGFFLKDDEAAPEFRGTMNIMARSLHSTW